MCCPLGDVKAPPPRLSAGVWRPEGGRGHDAAVPCLTLGCGDPSQGLDIVWAGIAGHVAGNMGAQGLGPKETGAGKGRGTQWD